MTEIRYEAEIKQIKDILKIHGQNGSKVDIKIDNILRMLVAEEIEAYRQNED